MSGHKAVHGSHEPEAKVAASRKVQPATKSATAILLVIFSLLAIAIVWRTMHDEQRLAPDASSLDLKDGSISSDTLPPTENTLTSATEIDANKSTGRLVSTAHCPIPVAAKERIQYSQGRNIETWRYTSYRGSRDLASELLIELKDKGYELVKADFLDLYGNAWGCTVKSPDGETFVIAMLPQKLGANNSSENKVNVSIVHIRIPKTEVGTGGEDK